MSATVPQSTTTTSSSLSSRIAVPANLSSDRGPLAESLTQGLWRFPVLSTADTLNPSSSNKSTGPIKLARDHHSEPRTPASLASIIGVKKNISDISPHEFWNRVRGIDGKEIVLVINGDLIRDRIRNWSLPCAYFTALLQAAPKHFHQTSTLAVRTSTITAPPRSLASYLKHGLQPQLPVNEASSTDDLAHVSWERSYPPAFPLLSVVISNGADGSEFLHCGFSAKLALESACESGKAIWFVVVSNEFLVEEEHWKKERSIQMFFDLDDLPSSPAQLIQIALLGPSTLLPSRLHTLRQSILHLRQGRGYHFLVDKLRGYLQRWEKFTVEPKYRERRYLIAEKEPRKPVERPAVGKVVWRGGLVGEKGMMGSGDWKKWFGDGKVIEKGQQRREGDGEKNVVSLPSHPTRKQTPTPPLSTPQPAEPLGSIPPTSNPLSSDHPPAIPPPLSHVSNAITHPRQPICRPHPPELIPTKIAIPLFSTTKRSINPASPQKSASQHHVTIFPNSGRSGIPRPSVKSLDKPSTQDVTHVPMVRESSNLSPFLQGGGGEYGVLNSSTWKTSDTKLASIGLPVSAIPPPPATHQIGPQGSSRRKRQRDNALNSPARKRPKTSLDDRIPPLSERRRHRGAIELSSATRIPRRAQRTTAKALGRPGKQLLVTMTGGTQYEIARPPTQQPSVGSLVQRQGTCAAKEVDKIGNASAVRVLLRPTTPGNAQSTIPRPKFLSPTKSNVACKLPPSLRISVPSTSTTTTATAFANLRQNPLSKATTNPPSPPKQPILTPTSASTETIIPPNFVPSSSLQKKVAILHQTPSTGGKPASTPSALSLTLRNKLDYNLSHFSLLPSSESISRITLKEFLAMLLNSRQLGRMTGLSGGGSKASKVDLRPKVPVQRANSGGDDDQQWQKVFWEGRRVEGVVMRGIMPEMTVAEGGKSTKICVYGCKFDGVHQWLSGTRLTPNSLGHQTSLFALGKALLSKLIKDKVADDDVRAWYEVEKGDKEFVETDLGGKEV